MVKKYQIVNNKVVESTDGNDQILIYIAPDNTEKKYLIDELKIDEHNLNSSLDPDELARVEFESDHLALIYKRPKSYNPSDHFLFKVSSIGLFLFKKYLIIVMTNEVSLFDSKHFMQVTSLEDTMLKLLNRSIFHFLEHLKIINMIADAIEQKISSAMENKNLLNLFMLEKGLVYYLNAISSNSMLIEKIKYNALKIGLVQENLELLEDLIIENNQCYKQAEIYSNVLASLMDARASIVSNNLNVLLKTLNIITIGIMVPTLVVSAFSMNVIIPLQKHPYAFWIIMGFALFSVMGLMMLWKYKKW